MPIRFRTSFAVVLAVSLLTLTGCATASGDSRVLPNTALSKILPSASDYEKATSGMNWSVQTTREGSLSKPARLSAPAAVTATQAGAACSDVYKTTPVTTYSSAANQEVGYGGEDEAVLMFRMTSAKEATSYFHWQKRLVAACTKNQGQVVFASVRIGPDSALGYTVQQTAGSDASFIGVGQRGDLIVQVSNQNADGAATGAQTLKLILNHIDDLIRAVS